MKHLKQGSRTRSVTVLYAFVAAAILVAVATFAMVLAPPAPPVVAEFAPRADERIDEALKSQASSFGTGEGGGACLAGMTCTGGDGSGAGPGGGAPTTTIPATVDETRVRRCVGEPPRQTEDPQSPPCVNFWEGDNGGSTAKGVTRDEIRIAANKYLAPKAAALAAHFNKRYQFYGRKLRVVPVSSYDDPKLVAVAADEEADAFAVLVTSYDNGSGRLDQRDFQREAARRGMITASGSSIYGTNDLYRELAPYAWTYGPTFDQLQTNLGRFVCSSLADKTAQFAGNELKTKPRKFSVMVSKPIAGPVEIGALRDELARCRTGVTSTIEIDVFTDDDASHVAGTMARWQEDEVTTVLLLAPSDEVTQYMLKLPSSFEPEWVIGGVASHENEAQWGVIAPANYRRSLFGAFSLNKLLPRADTPSWWAYQEGPGYETGPSSSYDPAADFETNNLYHSLLLLASGIQSAGPNLTPERFAAGLRNARFPNPAAGGSPYYQAHVDFGAGDFSLIDDSSVVWWNDTAPSYGGGGFTKQGGWCYVGRGSRFDREWPDVSGRLFDPDPRNCR